ncbi:hypothetical protein ID866_9098 [Astraeus odoratus]|nr:hypothetical protein ID866_9098 [Astraeus odoratus]
MPAVGTSNGPCYPSNLTPVPSDLYLDCTVKDCIALWQPHPDSISLHTWADSTKASYGASLLVYHIFLNKNNIADPDRAPANSSLISHFILSLASCYTGQTIQGYMYSIRAWHMLNGLPGPYMRIT